MSMEGEWEGQEVIDSHRYPNNSRGPRKIVLSLLTLVDGSPITRFLQTFHKQYILPLSLQERHFLVGSCFCKTQAESIIYLMLSMSIFKKLLTWGLENKAGLNKIESEKLSISLCYSFVAHAVHRFWFCYPAALFLSMCVVGDKEQRRL